MRQVLQIKSWARALVDLRSRATSLCLTESDLPSSRPGFGAGTARSESQVLRDRRDEKRASIKMRNCRRMRDERWA